MCAHIREAASTATDIAMLSCRIAKDQRIRRYVFGHDRASANQGKLSDGDAADKDRAGANRGTVFYHGRCNLPFIGAFQPAIRRDSTWDEVVGEADMRANEDAIFQGDAFKDNEL